MVYTVTLPDGNFTQVNADNATVTPNGELLLTSSNGSVVAAFASGQWTSCRHS